MGEEALCSSRGVLALEPVSRFSMSWEDLWPLFFGIGGEPGLESLLRLRARRSFSTDLSKLVSS